MPTKVRDDGVSMMGAYLGFDCELKARVDWLTG